MKNRTKDCIIDSMIDKLTDWSLHLKSMENQVNEHKALSYERTAMLSQIVNQLRLVNKSLERSNFFNNELLISCFIFCLANLRSVYDKLSVLSKGLLLEIMNSNERHFYKIEGIAQTDLYPN